MRGQLTMLTPIELLAAGTRIFVAVVAVVLIYQVITGAIVSRGLLTDKEAPGTFSPVRFQLLVFTIIAAGQFLLSADLSQTKDASLPGINDELLYLLAGSQGIYLTGKGNSVFGLAQSIKFLR
ncbi:hypothetical protein [Roseibium sp.]|uniref:hypothetical protein n=1 Tax=Roseibium sp. TaxID=1936156 RepID=UPI003A970861